MSNLPVGQPGFRPKDNKYQPAKTSDRDRDGQADANKIGHLGKFNLKQAVNSNEGGSDYHSPHDKFSGLDGNFSKKDEAMAYLRERGKEGITVRHYSGGKMMAKVSTQNMGVTAYNNHPINETYKPGTGQNFGKITHPEGVDVPSSKPIIRPVIKKSETI
jgi:hypothetical protein